MPITLAIENEPRLPDGGPISIRITGKRGIDIGRDQHLDWTLPDPTRFISGKHCEIRYRDGGYWLHDVSSNGTFVNGSERRLHEPHRLRNGDRLEIGHYIISVVVDGEDAVQPGGEPVSQRRSDPSELWGVAGDVPPPISARDLQPPRRAAAPVQPDFLDWVVDVPDVSAREAAFVPASRQAEPYAPARPAPPPRYPPAGADRYGGETDLATRPYVDPAGAMPSPRRPAPGPGPGPGPSGDAWGEPAFPSTPMPPPAGPGAYAPPQAYAPAAEPAYAPRADSDFISRLARGAGVSPDVFASKDPGQLAEELGMVTRLLVENLKQLLNARAETRALVRSSRQTMLQALDNNPLKFARSAEEAMRVMFGPRTRSYLDAQQTLRQSFDDLKAHQLNTYSAMQQALQMLVEDLDPQAIEKSVESGLVGSRKGKLWDAYLARWQAKTAKRDGGLVEAFMSYFAECYQRNATKIR